MFPNGITFYLAGGVLIGLALSLAYLLIGMHVGVSTSLASFWSFFSKHPFFNQKSTKAQRGWRLVFVIFLAVGAALYVAQNKVYFVTSLPWWQLLLGGILVGFGVRMANGCTSGHGVNGLSSFNKASIVAVIIFVGVAIATAHLAQMFGVIP